MEGQPRILAIPNDILKLIPLFGGDNRQLNLFLRKCDYVIERYRGNEEQNLYVYHAVTSRLIDNAAALLSEREDIESWSELKALLEQHFGDPRSEECINIELESLKIKSNESYLEFCNRIQTVRSILISKVNALSNAEIKIAKIAIYNHTALNVFLYNLPENMVRIVRLKAPASLEAALSIVLEEVNFHEQYTLRNRMYGNSVTPKPTLPNGFSVPQNPTGYRPILPANNNTKFSFGSPQNQQYSGFRQQPNQQFGYRPPQFGYRPPVPQQFGYKPPNFGMMPQRFGYKPPMAPQQFGYRPPMAPQQFGYRPPTAPQQFGYRHPTAPQQFGYRPQPFGYRPNIQKPHYQATDVSMRTAPLQQNSPNGFKLNELALNSDYIDEECYDPKYYYPDYCDEQYDEMTGVVPNEQYPEHPTQDETEDVAQTAPFRAHASTKDKT